MNYLLDTCIISHFARGNQGVVERIKGTPPRRIHIPAPSLRSLNSQNSSKPPSSDGYGKPKV